MRVTIIYFLIVYVELNECLNCYLCSGTTGCNDPFNSLGSGVETTGTNSANTYCIKINYIGTITREGGSTCTAYSYSSNAYQTCCQTDFFNIYKSESISCISCSNTIISSCGEIFNITGLNIITNQTFCQKSVSVQGVIQRSGGQICPTSTQIGITSVYCCSNQDYCNNGNNIKSIISFIHFITILLFQI